MNPTNAAPAPAETEPFVGGDSPDEGGYRDPRKMPPYQEQMAATELTKAQMQREFGDSGTPRWMGYYDTDYNQIWENRERFEIVEKMRRGDPDVKALLRAVKSPLLAAKWSITVDSDDEEDQTIRDEIEDNVMGGMKRSWNEFLREALGYLDFGVYPFELIWSLKDGKVWLKDMAPRIPRSILRWRTSDGRFGIQQLILTDEFETALPEVPAEKLFVITNEKEGDDVTGQSILRAAFKPWSMKETAEKIQIIAIERHGVGVPVFMPGEKTALSDAEKSALENTLANLRSNEKGFIMLTRFGDKIEIASPSGAGMGTMIQDAIDYHSKMIPISVLANFLTVGRSKGQGGGRSQSEDLSGFFTLTLNDIAGHFCEQFSKQVIEKIVRLNHGERDVYPKLVVTDIESKNILEYGQAMAALAGANLLDITPSVKIAIRKEVHLPDYTSEQEEAMNEQEIADAMKDLLAAENPPPPVQTDANGAPIPPKPAQQVPAKPNANAPAPKAQAKPEPK